ncbi:hypothetical protein [Neisseria sp.]|uniref:hypothetical protein n=1 Tax=Neisseria sp. TaxID=192066 RepID=UPI00359F2E4D
MPETVTDGWNGSKTAAPSNRLSGMFRRPYGGGKMPAIIPSARSVVQTDAGFSDAFRIQGRLKKCFQTACVVF